MNEITLASAGLQERSALQRWLTEYPDLIAPDLLLITTEFDRWAIREQKVADRLDALFLDSAGAPVVVEFKRDKATDTVELQALKYAAYCSQLTLEELSEDFASGNDLSDDDGRQRLINHAPLLGEQGLGKVKIWLVAGGFGPAVTSVVLWLRDYGVEIGCIEVTMRRLPDASKAVISARQLLPLPEAEDYLVRRRRKEQEEEAIRRGPAAEWTWDGYQARFPSDQLAIAKRLFDALTIYVDAEELDWTPMLRSYWLGFMRPGNYYVPVINLQRKAPIEFAVKLPVDPVELDLQDPYPGLQSWWDGDNKQWTWAIPTIEEVPDVRLAVELARPFQPPKGPMRKPPPA